MLPHPFMDNNYGAKLIRLNCVLWSFPCIIFAVHSDISFYQMGFKFFYVSLYAGLLEEMSFFFFLNLRE